MRHYRVTVNEVDVSVEKKSTATPWCGWSLRGVVASVAEAERLIASGWPDDDGPTEDAGPFTLEVVRARRVVGRKI